MHHWFCRALVLVATCTLTCTGAFAQTPTVVKLSHVVSPDTAKGKAALKFKELAEKKTSGKTRKLYEVQKHGVLTFHRHPVYAFTANKKWWDELPADVRKALEEAVVQSTRYYNEIAQKENADAVELMKKSGKIEIYQPSPVELDAWRKVLLPVHKQMESKVPKDLVAAIYKETGVSK